MKRIMICADLTDESINLFKEDVKKSDWSGVEEVHIVHAFKLQHYADAFYFTSYPPENQYDDIEKSVKEVLAPLVCEVKVQNSKIKFFTKCIIGSSPKEVLAKYAKDELIDSMVIGTRGKHGIEGLFLSSFAEYMVRYAPCELRIIRAS